MKRRHCRMRLYQLNDSALVLIEFWLVVTITVKKFNGIWRLSPPIARLAYVFIPTTFLSLLAFPPAPYFLLAILIFVFGLALPGVIGIAISVLIGGASILAGITAVVKRSNLGGKIKDLQSELDSMESDPARPERVEGQPDTAPALAHLKTLLDQNLITQEEYTTKRSEIINRI